jgi:hypothetical protein
MGFIFWDFFLIHLLWEGDGCISGSIMEFVEKFEETVINLLVGSIRKNALLNLEVKHPLVEEAHTLF